MIPLLLGHPAFCAYASAALVILFGLVALGHRVLDLLRDYRDYRDGR